MRRSPLLWLRWLIAAAVFTVFFLAFVISAKPFAGIAQYQIGPAILAASLVFLAAMAGLALCFGRVYCAALCPLGITQDILGRVLKKRIRKPLPRHFGARIAILALFMAALLSGFLFLYGLLDPYSAFGRICGAVFAPLSQLGNNLLAMGAEAIGSDAFTWHEPRFPGWPAFLAGSLTLAILAFLVWRLGRVWCSYCPVGTALGLLSRKPLFRIQLDQEKCVGCRRCEKICKTGCIDIKGGNVDASRCVVCQNCARVCPAGAIDYGTTLMKSSSKTRQDQAIQPGALERRSLIRALPPLAALLALWPARARASSTQEINRPDVEPVRRTETTRNTPITPPGSLGAAHFGGHCTGCQLCVEACPNNALKTSINGTGIFQPGLAYEYGYCRPNCVKCGEVCPAGAIGPITPEEKARIRIGAASVDFKRCIVNVDQVPCTACSRICPNEAISLIPVPERPDELKRPVVDAAKCTGCGACEYVCAARPLAAITVNGLVAHETIHADPTA